MALFDTYVMVDWSAAAVPTLGRDSIWYALRAGRRERCANLPTRAAAQAALRTLLLEQRGLGRRVLVGFDFPFGYPTGFAAALGLEGWRGIWRFLAEHISDGDDNANDRFAAAARINRERFGGAFPFWGHPPGRTLDGLAPVKHAGFRSGRAGSAGFAERRLCELQPGARSAKTVWQLAYTGSVGSQVLVGLPRVLALREHRDLRGAARIWPFETRARGDDQPPIVIAEIWPSLWPEAWRDLETRAACRDEAQVRGLARLMQHLDRDGALAHLLDPPLSRADAAQIGEEAWILGLA
jgi:precorrin-8X/cobalt-precorrin-8 methylmutase